MNHTCVIPAATRLDGQQGVPEQLQDESVGHDKCNTAMLQYCSNAEANRSDLPSGLASSKPCGKGVVHLSCTGDPLAILPCKSDLHVSSMHSEAIAGIF
jgi:hypothetical protein